MAAKASKPVAIRSALAEGKHSLSPGRVMEVVALVSTHPEQIEQLVECLWDDDPGVASRAADCLERLTRVSTELVNRWKAPLLGLLAEATHKKLRWNLALTIPRFKLSVAECRRAAAILESYLTDRSSIVKTAALQGLADLARQDAAALPGIIEALRVHSRSGTPAMRARSRILLKKLERPATKRIARPQGELDG